MIRRFVLGAGCALAALFAAAHGARADNAAYLAEANREEAALRQSPLVEHDPALNARVRDVLCRVAADECPNFRLYILRSADFGARTLPNGAIELGVGLIWRSANEAQLAFVLSRQVAHYVSGHARESEQTEDRIDAARLAIGTAAALAGVYPASEVANFGLNAAERTGESSREREADRIAIERMTAAGYDVSEAVALSTALVDEARAGRFRRPSDRRDTDLNRAVPTTRGRVRALEAAPQAAAAATGASSLHEMIRPFLSTWLDADVRRRDFDASLFALDRLAAAPSYAGHAHYFRGQAFRLRREEGDAERALEAYQQAVQFDDAPAEAWRALGEAQARAGDNAAARAALQTYLDRAPQAEDRALIQARLDELQNP